MKFTEKYIIIIVIIFFVRYFSLRLEEKITIARRYMKPLEDTAICSYLVGLYLFFSFSHQVPAMAEGFSGTRNDPAVSQTFSRAKLFGGEY
jgi:hypothetical protein